MRNDQTLVGHAVSGNKLPGHTILRHTTPRWRVALVGGTPPERANLGAAISRHGGAVAVETASTGEGIRVMGHVRPDVAIVVIGPEWHGGSVLFRLRDEAHCPVVLNTGEPSRLLLDEAREAGVVACLVPPIRPLQLAATLDLAVARFRDAEALRQRLADRKVIERAKGRLMAQYGLTEEQAFRRLRRAAMDAQRPLAEMASAVLLSGTARQQGHQDLL